MSLNTLMPWFRLFEIDADVRVNLKPTGIYGPTIPARVRVLDP
jgi:hypothetical protein